MPPPASPKAHKVAAERSEIALLLIDVINPFDFTEAPKLLRFARPAARQIAALKQRMKEQGMPVIYVNDNFGQWRSDFRAQIRLCSRPACRGASIARLLHPDEDDYFVLKPKHSGFFCTSLEILLRDLGVRRLILTGFAGNICVLYTANDAYLRDFELIIPASCLASESAELNAGAIRHMQRFLHAEIFATVPELVKATVR